LFSKNKYRDEAWQLATETLLNEILENRLIWGKELQLQPKEIGNKVLLSKNKYGNTAWHLAAKTLQDEILKKLLNWTKELQLIPEDLRKELLLSIRSMRKRPVTTQ
jgi:ankyrin repeat protein